MGHRCGERECKFPRVSSYKGTNLIRPGPRPHDPLNPDYLPKAPSPNTRTLRVRASTHGFKFSSCQCPSILSIVQVKIICPLTPLSLPNQIHDKFISISQLCPGLGVYPCNWFPAALLPCPFPRLFLPQGLCTHCCLHPGLLPPSHSAVLLPC